MALIVEDGTGLPAANSYVSRDYVNEYHELRLNTGWTEASDTAKDAALVRATAALDALYATRWPGCRLKEAQALDWPRYEAYDREDYLLTGIPESVKKALCEAALAEVKKPGTLSASLDRGGAIVRDKIGPLETEYERGAPRSTIYPAIGQALARIVRPGGQLAIVRG